MTMNLFSIFDPSSSPYLSLNWLSLLIMFMIIPLNFWMIPSRYYMLWNFILMNILKEFKVLIHYSYSNMIVFLSLFILILSNNSMSLFPYIFPSSSHMSFCLTLSMSLWIGMMIYGWLNFMNDMFTHLTPLSTPTLLMPFMVIIETISLTIRPITLSIRLTANMIAGHLLLSLLGSSLMNLNMNIMLPLLFMSQLILMILEIAVSLIQAYVFSILTSLYSSEI